MADFIATTLAIIDQSKGAVDKIRAEIASIPNEHITVQRVVQEGTNVPSNYETNAFAQASNGTGRAIPPYIPQPPSVPKPPKLINEAPAAGEAEAVGVGGSEAEAGALGGAEVGAVGMLGKLASIIPGGKIAMVGIAAVAAATYGIIKIGLPIVKAAITAQTDMNLAFKDSPGHIGLSKDALDQLIATNQNYGHTMADTEEAIATLTRVTGSAKNAQMDMVGVENLAASKHESLTAAASQYAMALTGNARALKTLGITNLGTAVTVITLAAAERSVTSAEKAVTAAVEAHSNAVRTAAHDHEKYQEAVAKDGAGSTKAADALYTYQGAQDKVTTSAQKLSAAQAKLSAANAKVAADQKALANPTARMSLLNKDLQQKVGGLADAQSQGLMGSIDKINAGFQNFVAGVGMSISNWFDQNKTTINEVATIIGQVLVVAVNVLATAFGIAFKIISFEVGVVIAVIKTIVGIVQGVVSGVRSAIGGIGAIFNSVVTMWNNGPGKFFGTLAKDVGAVFAGVGSAIGGAFKTALNVIISIIDTVLSAVQNVINAVPTFGLGHPTIPLIPKLAAGGIATSPTLALIGEAGPEAVVPLSSMGNLGGSGGDVYVTLSFPNSLTFLNNAAQIDALTQAIGKRFATVKLPQRGTRFSPH